MDDHIPDHDQDDEFDQEDHHQDNDPPANWNEEPAERMSNPRRVAAFQRLMVAEERLHQWWEQRHPATTWVTELLGNPVEDNTDLWIAALGEKIAAMGGHLELTAVFENETLTLIREPGPYEPRT